MRYEYKRMPYTLDASPWQEAWNRRLAEEMQFEVGESEPGAGWGLSYEEGAQDDEGDWFESIAAARVRPSALHARGRHVRHVGAADAKGLNACKSAFVCTGAQGCPGCRGARAEGCIVGG